jgi:hypothetical protein
VSRSFSGFAVVALLISLPFLAWGAWEKWFERQNDEIARELPVYPNARLVGKNESLGSLSLVFELPRGASPAEVDAFYRERLGRDWDVPDRDCVGFRRGDDLLMFRIDSSDYRSLGVLINTEAADDCEEYAWFVHS